MVDDQRPDGIPAQLGKEADPAAAASACGPVQNEQFLAGVSDPPNHNGKVRYLVVGLDHSGRVEMFNPDAARLLGVDGRELLGQDWSAMALPPEQREEWKSRFSTDGCQTSLSPHCSSLVQPHTGEELEIEWQYTRSEYHDNLSGCIAIGVNAGEQKQVEQALKASEVRYRRLFETAKDGILILDAKTGLVVDANPYLSELLGLPHEYLVGKRIWELGLLKDVAANRENFLELLQHEYIRYEDLPLETADGQQIDAEFISNVYHVNGDLVIQCNIRNITARKRAEDELRELHSELENRVSERTIELAQANEALRNETVGRLRAEEMQLTAVVDERTRIARDIHDTLAQGFAGIVLQLEAAESLLAQEPQRAQGHVIKARELARASLADARRSMWALRPQMLEKGDLVFAIKSLVESLAKESSINIEFTHQGARGRLPKGIEDGLLRICQEALMNAGKHSQAKNISARLVFDDEQVELLIADDGRGFAVRSAPFLRGLGIHIMKERAANINGTFTISSQPGEGTQILVRVPVQAGVEGGQHG